MPTLTPFNIVSVPPNSVYGDNGTYLTTYKSVSPSPVSPVPDDMSLAEIVIPAAILIVIIVLMAVLVQVG